MRNYNKWTQHVKPMAMATDNGENNGDDDNEGGEGGGNEGDEGDEGGVRSL